MTRVSATRILILTLRNARHFGLAAVATAAAFLGAACSVLLDTSADQCTTDQDCTNRGGAFTGMRCESRVCVPVDAGVDATKDADNDADQDADRGPWGCLGQTPAPPDAGGTVAVTVPLVNLSTEAPVLASDVRAVVCQKIDVNCSSPIASAQPDSKGLLHLTLAAGFDGFVFVTPIVPDAGTTDAAPDVFVPSLVFFNPPIFHDTVYTTIVMVRASALGNIAAVEGTTLDPSLGAVFMDTVDCRAQPAAGVGVTINLTTSTTQGFYFKGGLPALNAPSTDVTGYAGFVNVPLGSRTVTGSVAATTQKIGSATVFTRASTISYTVLGPSP